MATVKVLTWNTLFAGYDQNDDCRALAQIKQINELCPDIFLMQEAKGFDTNGAERLFKLEQQIKMRGFLAVAPRTGQNIVIFIREPLSPIAFNVESANFHHVLASLEVAVPGCKQPITFISVHLCPNGSEVRRREAAYLSVLAAPDKLTLISGDFNSASPHDPEPVDWYNLSPHHRARYLADDLKSVDRSVLSSLEIAGWIDLGHYLDKNIVATVPTVKYQNTEFATMRCDYLLASKLLAPKAIKYEVIRNEITDCASDHYPIMATFKI